MPEFSYKGKKVELDEKGYLIDLEAWSPEVAEALAETDGLVGGLTPDHWRLVDFLRVYFKAKGSAPMIRVLCKETGFSLQHIYDLFPMGPTKGACRVAGLPRPDSCV